MNACPVSVNMKLKFKIIYHKPFRKIVHLVKFLRLNISLLYLYSPFQCTVYLYDFLYIFI